jgi:hypothetical protein
MRTIILQAVFLGAAPFCATLVAQEAPFYQSAPEAQQWKRLAAKWSKEQSTETTIQAIIALNAVAPGKADTDDLDWVMVNASAWRDTEQTGLLSSFITTRLAHKGKLTGLECRILSRALTAMVELPPTPATSKLRLALREFYKNGHLVDDLSILSQNKAICETLYPLCEPESANFPFSSSTMGKRLERRELYLKNLGSADQPEPEPLAPADPF